MVQLSEGSFCGSVFFFGGGGSPRFDAWCFPKTNVPKPIAEGSSEEHMDYRQQLVFVSGIEF